MGGLPNGSRPPADAGSGGPHGLGRFGTGRVRPSGFGHVPQAHDGTERPVLVHPEVLRPQVTHRPTFGVGHGHVHLDQVHSDFATCSGRGSGAADCRPPAAPAGAHREDTHHCPCAEIARIVHLPNPRCRPAADIPYADLEEGAARRTKPPGTVRTPRGTIREERSGHHAARLGRSGPDTMRHD